MNPPRTRKSAKTLSPKQAARRVIAKLTREGYQALLAGGCVRDMLLGRRPHDYDIATSATPDEVVKLFPRSLTVGAQFGVVVVLLGGRQIEVATFRSDADYADGRRPEKVVFTDAREDALRRDFTVNGMFYDLLGEEVIDYVGGQKDLKKGVVRAIGNPNERFAEDHLRMLRAIRFAARLQFKIDSPTWQAIRSNGKKIRLVSAERIFMELEHILTDPARRRGISLARESGLLTLILKDMSESQIARGIDVLAGLPGSCALPLALAALLVDCGKDQVQGICRELKTANDLRKQTAWLVDARGKILENPPASPGRLKQWLAQPLFSQLEILFHAWLETTGQSDAPLRRLKKQIRDLGDEPIAPPRLLDGHELIGLGTPPGPLVGRLAEELYLAQLENQVRTKPQARQWVANWLARHKPPT